MGKCDKVMADLEGGWWADRVAAIPWPEHQEGDVGVLMITEMYPYGKATAGDKARARPQVAGWQELRPSFWWRAFGVVRALVSRLWRGDKGRHEAYCFMRRRGT